MSNFLSLNRGQVVATTTLVNSLGGGMKVTYKSPKGKRFAFVFLGVEDDENPIEPTVILNQMGWFQEPKPKPKPKPKSSKSNKNSKTKK
jgi:hypothetical protein